MTDSSRGDNWTDMSLTALSILDFLDRNRWIGTACSRRHELLDREIWWWTWGTDFTAEDTSHQKTHICNTQRCYCPMKVSSSWKTMSATISSVSSHYFCSSVLMLSCAALVWRSRTWRHFSGLILPNLSLFFFCSFACIISVQSALCDRMTGRGSGRKGMKGEEKE